MFIAARRVRNSHIALRPRSTARNSTVIGPMRALPAQSKLRARREESVASRGGSTRRLLQERLDKDPGAMRRRSSIQSVQ